jgi:small subunit ribosomal protein S17
MPKKKTEEVVETATEAVTTEAAEATEETVVEAQAEEAVEAQTEETVETVEVEAQAEEKSEAVEEPPKKDRKDAKVEKTETVEAATLDGAEEKHSKRAEKIGIVASDKMTKTVTVRVDRLVKHPIYRKYVKRRKKFMAHDETGAGIGDKVRIVETRPLSARKRWRVVEIIQKAEK